ITTKFYVGLRYRCTQPTKLLSMCRVCYGFRNAPKSLGGALAYGITHPTRLLEVAAIQTKPTSVG
ncbi:hypothetical protein, partial [Nostoc sp.]